MHQTVQFIVKSLIVYSNSNSRAWVWSQTSGVCSHTMPHQTLQSIVKSFTVHSNSKQCNSQWNYSLSTVIYSTSSLRGLEPLGGFADPRRRLEKTQVGGFAPVHGSAHPMRGVLQTQASRCADLGAKVSKLQVSLQTLGARVCRPARLDLQLGACGLQSYYVPPNSAIYSEITHTLQ